MAILPPTAHSDAASEVYAFNEELVECVLVINDSVS